MSETTRPAVNVNPVPANNGDGSLGDRVRALRLGDQLAGSKTRGSTGTWIPWALCFLMGITWASFAVRSYSQGGFRAIIGSAVPADTSQSGPPTTTTDAKDRPTTGTATPNDLVLEVKGYVIAAHQIQVSPIEVSGRIKSLHVEEGKLIRKGQVLAEIDDTPYMADFLEAQAALNSARSKREELETSWPMEKEQADAQLKEAESLLEQYQRDYQRYEEIRNKNNVAEKEFEQAKYAFLTQSARVRQLKSMKEMIAGPRRERIEAARADEKQAEARLKRAEWRLRNCKITSPVDGIVLTKRAEIGNLVNALAMNASLNGGICDIADLTDLEIDLEIQERDIRKVFVDQECSVRADAYPERRYAARVDRIMPVANSSKAIVPIRVKVRVPRKEEGKYLKPQMGAVVSFFNRQAGPEPAEPADPKIVE
jgi:multidrug resistance efflux pump